VTGLVDDLAKTTLERDKWKAKAKERWWLLFIIIAAAIVIIFRKPIFSFIKPVFMKFFVFVSMLVLFASCGHFHDEPTVSVWAKGAWLVFWVPFLGSFFFFGWALRSVKSGTNQQTPGGIVDVPGKIKWWKTGKGIFAICLFAFSWAAVWYFNSGNWR
jgi:pheromone shutdown protein TraB